MSTRQVDHPADEWLCAYVAGTLDPASRAAVRAHLADCDRCVGEIVTAHARFAQADRVNVQVPVPVARRADVYGERAVRWPASGDWGSRARAWLERITRIPVLAPASFAVGVLVMLAVYPQTFEPRQPANLARSAAHEREMRVTVPEALLRGGPTADAPVVGRVRRDQKVVVIEKAGDWCHVLLTEGVQGWVERRSLQ